MQTWFCASCTPFLFKKGVQTTWWIGIDFCVLFLSVHVAKLCAKSLKIVWNILKCFSPSSILFVSKLTGVSTPKIVGWLMIIDSIPLVLKVSLHKYIATLITLQSQKSIYNCACLINKRSKDVCSFMYENKFLKQNGVKQQSKAIGHNCTFPNL